MLRNYTNLLDCPHWEREIREMYILWIKWTWVVFIQMWRIQIQTSRWVFQNFTTCKIHKYYSYGDAYESLWNINKSLRAGASSILITHLTHRQIDIISSEKSLCNSSPHRISDYITNVHAQYTRIRSTANSEIFTLANTSYRDGEPSSCPSTAYRGLRGETSRRALILHHNSSCAYVKSNRERLGADGVSWKIASPSTNRISPYCANMHVNTNPEYGGAVVQSTPSVSRRPRAFFPGLVNSHTNVKWNSKCDYLSTLLVLILRCPSFPLWDWTIVCLLFHDSHSRSWTETYVGGKLISKALTFEIWRANLLGLLNFYNRKIILCNFEYWSTWTSIWNFSSSSTFMFLLGRPRT